MQSKEHFLLSLPTTALALVPAARRYSARELAVLACYGVGLGVFIDLDHFVLARVHVGDWRHLRDCLRDPVGAFTDQEGMFEGLGMARQRLVSHLLIGGVLTLVTGLVDRAVAVLTAAVLSVHVLADVLRDREDSLALN